MASPDALCGAVAEHDSAPSRILHPGRRDVDGDGPEMRGGGPGPAGEATYRVPESGEVVEKPRSVGA
jgi:hypothetical protein